MTFALTAKSKTKPAASGKRAAKHKPVPNRSIVESLPGLGGLGGRSSIATPTIQTKLKVGEPNDRFEQEADRVADEVLRMPDSVVTGTSGLSESGQNSRQSPENAPPFLQRKCSECAAEDETRLQRSPLPSFVKHPKISALNGSLTAQFQKLDLLGSEPQQITPVAISEQTPLPKIQRLCPECEEQLQRQPMEEEEKLLQGKEMPNGIPQVSSNLSNPVDAIRGGGQPLPKSVRAFVEPRFGQDFSHVRIHTGSKAAESAEALNARAYTIGQQIVFGKGQYAPEIATGKRLLAHELVHTVQQGQTTHGAKIQRVCGPTDIATTVGTRAGCTDNFDGTFVPSPNLFKFNKDCDDFAAGQEAALIGFATGLSPTTTFELHGFASVDGPADFNQNLGCARASKAQSVLTRPSPVGAGIAAARITGVINHGPVPGPAGDRRSVVIRTTTPPSPPPPPPTPLTVAINHIQAITSPTGMPDRIPPRVDTIVGVGIVGFTPPMLPITLSIEGAGGGNGTATINGAATLDLTASAAVRLRGIDQTDVGKAGNLRLVANQGGTRLAASNNFSVSAIPQNHTIAFNCLIPDTCSSGFLTGNVHGFKVTHTWESDSTVVGDLDKTDISERVEIDSSGGSFSGTSLTTSGYIGEGTLAIVDEHATNATSTGFVVLKQTQMFKDNRTGAVNIPVTNSGYQIGQFILPIPGTGFLGFFQDFKITTMKFGFATTALGISSGAGSGSVTRTQNI
jgi:hypothetical protein